MAQSILKRFSGFCLLHLGYAINSNPVGTPLSNHVYTIETNYSIGRPLCSLCWQCYASLCRHTHTTADPLIPLKYLCTNVLIASLLAVLRNYLPLHNMRKTEETYAACNHWGQGRHDALSLYKKHMFSYSFSIIHYRLKQNITNF